MEKSFYSFLWSTKLLHVSCHNISLNDVKKKNVAAYLGPDSLSYFGSWIFIYFSVSILLLWVFQCFASVTVSGLLQWQRQYFATVTVWVFCCCDCVSLWGCQYSAFVVVFQYFAYVTVSVLCFCGSFSVFCLCDCVSILPLWQCQYFASGWWRLLLVSIRDTNTEQQQIKPINHIIYWRYIRECLFSQVSSTHQ